MFADTEEVEPDLIGERALRDDLAERVCLSQLFPLVINRDISKRIETQLNSLRHLGAWSLEVEGAAVTGLSGIGRFREQRSNCSLLNCETRVRSHRAWRIVDEIE